MKSKEIFEYIFVVVNYNNSNYTLKLAKSIEYFKENKKCLLIIVDNYSTNNEKYVLKNVKKIKIASKIIFNKNNIGYLAGINIGLKYIYIKNIEYNLIIVGNNDLIFPTDFIFNLEKNSNIFCKYPIISPNIISLEGRAQNPHIKYNISNFRMIIYTIYYTNYMIAVIIDRIAKNIKKYFERKDYTFSNESGEIFQGYGACYIITKIFVNEFTYFWTPNILMGEEGFITIQIGRKGFKIYYESSIIVNHMDHATCKNIPKKIIWRYAKKSFNIYKKNI